MPHFKYRKEIDGLRALAVIPVIFFHAGFSAFSGGYAGVDVFFVISGYLITSIILNDQANDRFTLLRFYERRARRILPALLLVAFTCLPLAWAWMMPDQLKDSQSLIAVVLFSSNVLFWKESDYFGATAGDMPMLHTWSLAVEEQFYVVFPLVLLALTARGRGRTTVLLASAGLVSLALAEWAGRVYPSANFYLAPTRAWELLLGSILAFTNAQRSLAERFKPSTNNGASLLGLVLAAFFATTPKLRSRDCMP